MKKKYFTKEAFLAARRERRKAANPDQKYKEKFINKETESGCWEWLGQKWSGGYGYLRPNRKHVPAHRYIYELYVGQIPEGLDLCHSCDNPGCVNPAHLWPGTVSENMKDAFQKGRKNVRGINNPNYRHGNRTKPGNTDVIKFT